MKKTPAVLLIFILIWLYSNSFASTEKELLDIKGHWAENEINYLLQNGVVNGYEDGTFLPNQSIRLAEFLKILIELSNYKLEVGDILWPNSYLLTAEKNEWIVKENFENPNQILTRYQVVEILGNYIGLKDIDKSSLKFLDLKKEEKEQVLKLVNLGIINGYQDKTFRGENHVTRAEACKMIKKAYEAKQKLLLTRKYELSPENTNIENQKSLISNRYEIKDNRIYIYDTGRYASLNGQTLNQEYINDKMVIKILETLIDEESYVELKFIPDKYIINSLNIIYGKSEESVLQGANYFQIRFYENGYYDVAKSKDEPTFMNDAIIKIKLGKMWEQPSEQLLSVSASEKNLEKLAEVLEIILGKEYKIKAIEFIREKRIEAGNIVNSESSKIIEVKNFGKYTLNIWCMQNQELEIFISKK